MRLTVYSPQDEFLFDVPDADIVDGEYREAVNGPHNVTIMTYKVLRKEQRVLHRDATGKVREWVISGENEAHKSGRVAVGTYQGVWSLQHDLSLTTVSRMPGVQVPTSAANALDAVLSGTSRWVRGTVTVSTLSGASMYEMQGWEAASVLLKNWGGEIDAEIEVDSSGVISRKVNLLVAMGDQTAKRRFDYRRDLTEMDRDVSEDVVAVRIIPRGKGEETENGGYGRKIKIGDVNGGIDWLQNDETAPLYRLPDGNGGYEYPTLYVDNGSIDDPQELKDWGLSVLDDYTTPKVTYTASVFQYAEAGMDVHGVSLGDKTQCVDREFCAEGLRIEGRVTEMVVPFRRPNMAQLTIGPLSKGVVVSLGNVSTRLSDLSDRQEAYRENTTQYLSNLIAHINEQANATGGYFYLTGGQGAVTYDKAVTDPTVGAEADRATEIRGGYIRLAASKTAQGQWNWTNLLDENGINAELVQSLKARFGTIESADGSVVIDLDNNSFRFGGTAQMDGRTVSSVLDAVDSGGIKKIEYGISDSSSTAPQTWVETVPASVSKGSWLWVRTTYKNDNTSITKTYAGNDGTSVTILGSYNTLADLQQAHPTGTAGDSYIVAGDLYVWNGTAWEDVGQIQGPAGPDGRSVAIQSSTKVGKTTTVVMTDGTTTSTIRIDDGDDGATGQAGANGYVHIAWANSSDGSVDFSTSVSTNKTYIGAYTDNTQTDSQTYSDYNWSLIRGADGADGYNTATVFLYQRAASAPSKPSGTLTYTFATHTLSGTLGSWSSTIPSGTDPCWVIAATATSNTATDTIASNEWSSVVKLAENGAKGDTGAQGVAGTNQATIHLFQRASSAPQRPTTNLTYKFSDGSLTGILGNWSRTIPTANGNPCWVTSAAAIGNGATDDIAASEWSAVTKMAEDGVSPYNYAITANPSALVRTASGTLSPTSVRFSATRSQGVGSPSAYYGRFKVETYNGTAWTTQYTSSSDETGYTYSPSSTDQLVRGTLYLSGGTTTQLDTQTVPIAKDGSTGATGGDAYTVLLTNESHTFAADTTAAVAASTTSSVIAYKGATQVAATIGTITGTPSGMTTTVSGSGTTNATITVNVTTELTTRSGVLLIPVTVDGKSFTLTFSWSLALTGAQGDEGIGIKSIVEQYYLSTSAVQLSGGSWSDQQPSWSSGKYIWIRQLITWDDDTTKTSDAVLAKGLNDANSKAVNAANKADGADTKAGQAITNTNNLRNEVDTHVTNLTNKIDNDTSTLDGRIDNEVNAINESIDNQSTTINSRIDSEVNSLNSDISAVSSNLAAARAELGTAISDARRYADDYLSYENGRIILGSPTMAVKNVLSPEAMAFVIDGVGDVAYIGLNSARQIWELFIQNARITDMLTFGNFAWIARQNGNMTIKYLG